MIDVEGNPVTEHDHEKDRPDDGERESYRVVAEFDRLTSRKCPGTPQSKPSRARVTVFRGRRFPCLLRRGLRSRGLSGCLVPGRILEIADKGLLQAVRLALGHQLRGRSLCQHLALM